MSGATLDSLKRTLRRLRRRRAALLVLRQGGLFAAALAAAALAASALALWLEPGPAGLVALSGAAAAAALLQAAWLVRALRRRRGDDRALAHYVEDRVPDLEQRLLTSLEFGEGDAAGGREGVSRQLVRELWRDAEAHVLRRRREVETAARARGPWLSFAGSAAVAAAAAALIAWHPPLGEAAGRLARSFAGLGAAPGAAAPAVEIRVEPGSIELQRGDGVAITARIAGAAPDAVTLRLQDDNVNWRDVPMRRDGPDGAVFSHFIASVEKDTAYYVSFGERRSPLHRIALFDLPRVERIDLAFDYPPHTGMDDRTEEDGGDMAVPEGTVVDLVVTFNKPVAAAAAAFDWRPADGDGPPPPGEELALAPAGAVAAGRFTADRDGVYRIAATDFAGLRNRDPLEYFVRVIRDEPPELTLRRPGRDQDAMPLEEVIIEADAGDDYGLSEFALHYSVAGGEERRVDLLPEAGARRAAGAELLYLEDLAVEPGDFVSYFFTLADNNGLAGPAELVSDIYFLQVIPTDQEFRRARGGGGGQGGGGDGSALIAIQKDIIAATWKLRNRQGEVPAAEFSADASVVAASQREAAVRARRSIDRLAERLDFSDDTYASAVENLSLAIEQMNLAAAELELEQVAGALGPEQRALRLILKAEASVNRTDVAMGRGAGGGGRAARREREDLRELFEMEMGRLENRYETPDRAGGSREQREEAGRLEELARRQEGLSRAQRDLARRAGELDEERRRRELERLRRRQERLSEEVARLARERSRGRGAASGPPEPGAAGDEPRTALEEAARQMREAARSESPSIAAARGRKALESLRERQRELERQGDRSVAQLARGLGERGRELSRRQRELEQAVERTGREQGLGRTRDAAREDEAVAGLLEARQRRQRDLDEIDDMLRAVIARGEDRRLLSQAQEASRALRSVREETRTSDRVLRGGMLGLSRNIEREIGGQVEELARGLSALSPDGEDAASGLAAQTARDAEALKEQLEALERQALAFNEAGGAGAPTVRAMRERLARSGELARRLQRRLEERPGGGAGPAWGGARAIRRELDRREIEDFLNRPELFRRLLEPAAELADALRSRAELDGIGERLRAAAEEEVPAGYRELVEEYYRALSGTGGPSRP